MERNGRFVAAGVFDTRREAETAVEELRRAGFSNEQIGIAGSDADAPLHDAGTRAEEGAVAGAIGGGTLGALGGVAVAAGAISPIGPAVAGGLLAGLLASTAVGAAAGGVVGALTGLGFPEEEARHYEEELAVGRPLVTVRAPGRYDEAVAILRRCGARDSANRPPVEEVPPVPIL
jgi:hypothetical protein